MANKVLWAAETSADLITNAEPADGAGVLGTAYDNATNKYRWMGFELEANQTDTGTTGVYELYLLYTLDGSTYEQDGATSQPAANRLVATFAPRAAAATLQTLAAGPVLIMPDKFKPVVWNSSGADPKANTVKLVAYPYNEEIQ